MLDKEKYEEMARELVLFQKLQQEMEKQLQSHLGFNYANMKTLYDNNEISLKEYRDFLLSTQD